MILQIFGLPRISFSHIDQYMWWCCPRGIMPQHVRQECRNRRNSRTSHTCTRRRCLAASLPVDRTGIKCTWNCWTLFYWNGGHIPIHPLSSEWEYDSGESSRHVLASLTGCCAFPSWVHFILIHGPVSCLVKFKRPYVRRKSHHLSEKREGCW